MTTDTQLDQAISKWLAADAPPRLPDGVLHATFDRTRNSRQVRDWRGRFGSAGVDLRFVAAAVAVGVVAVATLGLLVNRPSVGTVGVTPTAAPIPTPITLGPGGEHPMSWSRDGTRAVILKSGDHLFVINADGSQAFIGDPFAGLTLLGSSRPAGATISSDGSRVVYAGVTTNRSCHDGVLFVVDADGGPATVLRTSQLPQNGILRYPTFSPDGTRLAYVDDYCDRLATVWVMNADGSGAQRIVGPIGCGHVYGLAWSPASDRIALQTEECQEDGSIHPRMYTFAPDGSGFTADASVSNFCWPGRRCPGG